MKSGMFAVGILCVTFAAVGGEVLTISQIRSESPARKWVQDRTVHVPEFDLPLSDFLSPETRAVLTRQSGEIATLVSSCPVLLRGVSNEQDVIETRNCLDRGYFAGLIARQRALFQVSIRAEKMSGVATEIITPVNGVESANEDRVLINLHGGTFMTGGRWGGQVESIPIAALGKIRVVSVDYRMAPEYRFPAASEDVAAVYQFLLRTYKPENIGIYGCSAGGLLTAQAVAWFQSHALPRPGAIGMLCLGAFLSGAGDSSRIGAAISGLGPTRPSTVSYFRDRDTINPLASPGLAPEVLSRFPDSLLVTSTRDYCMSSVVTTHSELVRLGVYAELHVWEGLSHAFFYEPEFPESREEYNVVVRFFSEHLGKRQDTNAVTASH